MASPPLYDRRPLPPPPPPSPPPWFNFVKYNGDHDPFEHKNTYDLNSKIMLTAVISLSFVVVLVIVLHIYARIILRRQARNRAIFRTLGLTTTASGEPPNSGLDPAVISSLPIFVYKQSCDHGSENDDNDGYLIECAVCLSFLEDQEMARILPNCKHTFHAECIDKWLSSHSNCPICRTEAEPRIQPVQREGPADGATTAPPLERVNSKLDQGTSESGNQLSDSNCNKQAAGGSSISRLSSFRRILSRERSSRRLQSEVQEHGFEDLERQ